MAIEESNRRLRELAENDPQPPPYALAELCLNPKSDEPPDTPGGR